MELDDRIMVIGYKTQLLAMNHAAYAAQLASYCAAVRQVRSDKPVRAMLVLVDGIFSFLL